MSNLNQAIKLIWDFKGPESEGIAKHHAIHLGEFANKESIAQSGFGHEVVSPAHSFAYLIIARKDMITVRDALKPNRAVLA